MIKKKGFTLIELLVVVAIIGLLATLSIVALNTARAKARDARRVADVKQIQTALELYYNDQGNYPTNIASLTPTYMGTVPYQPNPSDGPTTQCPAVSNNTTAYTYTMQDSNRSYTLIYCLGAATGGMNAGIGTATPAGIK